jgi:plasmid maintenance system antidote protein VapI
VRMTETAISLSQTAKAQTPLRVTIRNVAELAGVSTATVSNVINNTGSVSEATKQRVRAVIQRTKWTPNVDARNLARSTAEKPRLGEIE